MGQYITLQKYRVTHKALQRSYGSWGRMQGAVTERELDWQERALMSLSSRFWLKGLEYQQKQDGQVTDGSSGL